MVALMLLVFVSTQLIWALFPEVIGLRLPANSPVSLGVWFTVLTVLCAIALSGVYSLILTKPLDALNEQLIREINRHAH